MNPLQFRAQGVGGVIGDQSDDGNFVSHEAVNPHQNNDEATRLNQDDVVDSYVVGPSHDGSVLADPPPVDNNRWREIYFPEKRYTVESYVKLLQAADFSSLVPVLQESKHTLRSYWNQGNGVVNIALEETSRLPAVVQSRHYIDLDLDDAGPRVISIRHRNWYAAAMALRSNPSVKLSAQLQDQLFTEYFDRAFFDAIAPRRSIGRQFVNPHVLMERLKRFDFIRVFGHFYGESTGSRNHIVRYINFSRDKAGNFYSCKIHAKTPPDISLSTTLELHLNSQGVTVHRVSGTDARLVLPCLFFNPNIILSPELLESDLLGEISISMQELFYGKSRQDALLAWQQFNSKELSGMISAILDVSRVEGMSVYVALRWENGSVKYVSVRERPFKDHDSCTLITLHLSDLTLTVSRIEGHLVPEFLRSTRLNPNLKFKFR